jgi:hypothetical protein
MTIYIFSILLLFVFSCLELNVAMSPATKKAITLFAYIFLVLQVGLRWETGTDWNNYLQHFESINSFSSASPTLMSPEYGYNVAIWFIKIFFSNYSVFLIIHASVYYYLIFDSMKRYTGILFLPLMVFYCVTIGYTGSNRELIAVAIGLYALRYICDERNIYYYLLVAVACMFHASALILLLFVLFKRKIRPVALLLILVCSITIGASRFPELLFSAVGNLLGGLSLSKTTVYINNAPGSILDSGLTVFGLFKRLAFLSLFYCNRRLLSEKLRYYNVMLNAYIAGVILFFLFANSLPIMVSRGSLYFYVLETLLLASQVHLLIRRSSKLVMASTLCVLSVVFFLQSISAYPELFIPYRGISLAMATEE